MLEILAVIFLSGKMGELAERKGQKKGKWKAWTILGWFGAEIFGIVIGIVLFGSDAIGPILLFGYGLAIVSYFVIKAQLQKMPDADTSFEFEQHPPQV